MRIPTQEFPEGFAEWVQPLFDARQRFVAGLSAAQRSELRAIREELTALRELLNKLKG